MVSQNVAVALITAAVALVGAFLTYLGVRYQARTARGGSDASTTTQEREQLLEGWQALYGAHTDELQRLRADQERDRAQQAKDRGRVAELEKSLEVMARELRRWQNVAKTLARWGVTMRDQLRALGHEVPAEPDELVALQILAEAQGDDLGGGSRP